MKSPRPPLYAFLLTLLLGLMGTSSAQSAPLVVRVGYQPTSFPYVLAMEKGWLEEAFAKDNIVIKSEKFPVGPPIIEAFASKRLDFGFVADQPAIQARANHIDLKAIAGGSMGEHGYGLVALNGTGVHSVRDLKGKKVAVAVGSVLHQLLLIYLKSAGLTIGDVQLVNLTPADQLTSLLSGSVDAAVTNEPWISALSQSGKGYLVTDSKGYKKIFSLVIAGPEILQRNPAVATRLLQVLDRADKWSQAHPDDALAIVGKATGFKPEPLKALFVNLDHDFRLTPEAVKSISESAAFLYENRVIRNPVDVSRDLLDARYLKQAGFQN